ncbi:hypothetical protein HZA55_06105 [Candidatus Poribacteria bacterium]|nr:hypothetical protein [Candidatus Poribacteria bacterium]
MDTKTPHDWEFACNRCHGADVFGKPSSASFFGEPPSGRHTQHMEYVKNNENSDNLINLFRNQSYKDKINSKTNESLTVWDLCDECHRTSSPDQLDDLHLNKKTDWKVNEDEFVNFVDKDTKSCSKKGKCHIDKNSLKNIDDNAKLIWDTTGTTTFTYYDYYDREYKQDNCTSDCHFPSLDMARDTKTSLFLKSDIITMCNYCHGENKREETKAIHPLNIKIEEQVFLNNELPGKFGMDKYYFNIITCSTCHEPHGESCRTCHSNLNNSKIYKLKNNNVEIKKEKVYLRIEKNQDVKFNDETHSFKKEIFFQQGTYSEDSELKKVRDSLCNPCHTLETSLKVDVKDPHKEKKCNHCHKTIPTDPDGMCINIKAQETSDVLLRKGINRVESYLKFDVQTLCSNCHKEIKHLHPVNVKAKMKVPSELRLDEWNQITCNTCHDAHTNYSNKEAVPLYRMESEKNGLCYQCHVNDPLFTKINPHEFKDKNKCVFCHATESTTTQDGMKKMLERKPNKLYSKELNSRCNICHGKDLNTHKVGVFLSEDIADSYRLDSQNRITCGTCHDYHFVKKIIINPSAKSGMEDFCIQCHKDLEVSKTNLENIRKEIVK